MVRRRDFLILLGGASGAVAVGQAGAQPTRKPFIGFVGVTSYEEWKRYVEAFRAGLKDAGFVEGENVAIEYRWAEGHYDRLPAMMDDLIGRKVDVIVAIAPPAVKAVKAATTTIPVVFFLGSDPVKLGFVKSLNRPEANITGVSALANDINAKRLELLRQIAPASAAAGILVNPTNPNVENDVRVATRAAADVHTLLVVAKASTDAEIDAAFASFSERHVGGLIVNPDPFLLGRRERIAAEALRSRIATIFHTHEPVEAGGLMSYGASFVDGHRQVGVYTGRILKGAKPADLPIPLATKFDLAINVKTAKALGLRVPDQLIALADTVIE